MHEDNTVDIFTKKALSKIEEDAKINKDLMKKRLLGEVDKLKTDIENGYVTGIILLAVSEDGYRSPVQACQGAAKELAMMNYLLDSAKDVVMNTIYALEKRQEQDDN